MLEDPLPDRNDPVIAVRTSMLSFGMILLKALFELSNDRAQPALQTIGNQATFGGSKVSVCAGRRFCQAH